MKVVRQATVDKAEHAWVQLHVQTLLSHFAPVVDLAKRALLARRSLCLDSI